jgi:hypothetical protein
MQDVIVALYADHASAEALRTDLVKDGFPTDRVELTSPSEHRQAEVGPAGAFATNVSDYFRTLTVDEDGAQHLGKFARAVLEGAAALTVHPRGEEEIRRVERILERRTPREVYRYLPQDSGHVADRKIERAATASER